MNGNRLGELLMDADVITKRQLAKAIQRQVGGDRRRIGEILVEMGYVTVEDLTDIMLNNGHGDKVREVVSEPAAPEPTEISEDKILGTKFTMSIQTIVALVAVISSGIGGYYMLVQEIELAKQLPEPLPIEEIYSEEYPSRPGGHNWPSSKEQYKQQVGQLGRDMDELFDVVEELEDDIKELKRLVSDLRVDVAKKRDK